MLSFVLNANFMFRVVIFYILVVLSMSCKSSKKLVESNTDAFLYGLDRGACFGHCPVFSIRIKQDGLALLDAKRYNKIDGKFERKLTKEEFSNLKKSFVKTDLFKMDNEYATEVADLPATILYETKDGVIKKVKANEKMSEPFETTVDLLEAIVKNGDWILKEKYEVAAPARKEKAEDFNIYEEILIEPAEGLRLPVWLKEMEVYGVVLIKKASTEQNIWLISYDHQNIEPRKMLEILKKDNSIKTAEFNKRISNR